MINFFYNYDASEDEKFNDDGYLLKISLLQLTNF
jgi:hypothetical protein